MKKKIDDTSVESGMKLTPESAYGGPTLDGVFPSLFSKSCPVAEGGSPLIMVASLLRFHSTDAAMLLVDGKEPMRVQGRFAFV